MLVGDLGTFCASRWRAPLTADHIWRFDNYAAVDKVTLEDSEDPVRRARARSADAGS